jgi:non-specific serine/threonine protein kinase
MNTTTVRRHDNLPASLTSFVGRRHELAEVKRALSGARLVTLTGVGGVGKTRLALRVAESVERTFRDGVWLVELASLSDPAFLSQTVNSALRIPDQSGRPPEDVLVDYLADKQLLLVLDNCEHLVGSCARLADTLLRSCSKLRILATSREAFGIDGEYVPRVPSLSLPEVDQPALSPGALERYDAVRLFVARAEAVLPDFALSSDNCETVAKLCQQLEGIPLAIELAAVRLRHLPLQQINDRLDDRYRLLTSGSRTALPRQKTLRALIDWSFDLCSPRERTLWARLSVFSDSFELAAAEEVCQGGGVLREEVLGLLTGLIDKSILTRHDQGVDGRYRMLETIRQYGEDRLAESTEDRWLRGRHRDWCLRLVERAEAEWFGPDQIEWFTRLRLDHANVRSALDFCLNHAGGTESALHIAGAMRAYWHSTGFMGEGRHWLDQALQLETSPTAARAKALWVDSWLAVLQGDTRTAISRLAESRTMAAKLGDEDLTAQVTLAAGVVAMHQKDQESAVALFEEAIALHRGTGHLTGLAISLYLLGLTSTIRGDTERAVTVTEECRAICAAHGECWYHSHALWVLGIAVWQQGDARRATRLEQESIRLKPSLYDRLGIAHCIEALAWFAATDGRNKWAARLLGAAESARQAIGVSLQGFAHLVSYHRQAEAAVSQALGDAAYRKAFEHGLGLSLDQAVAHALNEKVASPADSERADPSALLTRRETEVAELVAQGLSNKEIAGALVVSQRTAEAHVENILVKLGFRSRAQIAAWFTGGSEETAPAEQKLPPQDQ